MNFRDRSTLPHASGSGPKTDWGSGGAARLVADYRAGRSTKWLQRTYGLSQGAVLRLLDVSGVPRRRRGLSDAQVQEAIRLYSQGWSLTRIGDRFGKDHTVVRNALLQVGVTLRITGNNEK